MIKISKHTLDFFISHNKLSAGRFYFYVKSKLNNHLHQSDFPQIQKDLNISLQVINKNIRQLKSLGVCSQHSENYIRFHSWRTWSNTAKNRIIDISIDKLKNLKILRTLHYFYNIRSAYWCSKKNSKCEKRQASSGFYPTSLSFIKKVTLHSASIQTFSKHLRRARDFNLLEYHHDYLTVMTSFSLADCLNCKKAYNLKSFYPCKINGMYHLRSYKPNLIRL